MKNFLLSFVIANCSLLIFNCSVSAQGQEWLLLNAGNSWVPDNYVMKTVWDTTGNLWIATWGKGFYKYDGKALTNFTKANSQLPNDSVYTIFLDSNYVKWVGTHEGLASYDGTTWKVFTKSSDALPDDDIKVINEDANFNMFVGTDKGGLMMYDQANWTFYNTSTPQYNTYIPNNSVYGIVIDSYDNKWAGTQGGGIGLYNDSIWTPYAGTAYLPSDTVNGIQMNVYENKWIATSAGLVFFDGSTWTKFNKTNHPSFPSNNITALTVDDNDNLWFATYDKTTGNTALGIYDNINFSFYNNLTSLLPKKKITDISFDYFGNAWISTFGGGIVIFNVNGINTIISVNNLKKNENSAAVYPNPCKDALNINFIQPPTKAAVITLTDIMGNTIFLKTSHLAHNTLNTANLSKGVYLLNIIMDDKVINKKIIKE
jgi:ligand-binding sensor domain-containing protein